MEIPPPPLWGRWPTEGRTEGADAAIDFGGAPTTVTFQILTP
jgi:hypothetical protein